MKLENAIIKLLANNNYISLPGLGSFVQRYEPAKLSADSKSFLPPQQIVTFDINRTFNDNAISDYLVETQAISEREAEGVVTSFMVRIKKYIDNGDKVFFEGIGYLAKDENGIPELETLPNDQRASSTFGLEPVEVDEVKTPVGSIMGSDTTLGQLEEVQAPVTPKKQHSTPVGHSLGKQVLAGIVSGLLIVLIGGIALYLLAPGLFDDFAAQRPTPSAKQQADQADTRNTEGTISIASDKREALLYQESEQTQTTTYYIISGSFLNIENAQKYHDNLAAKGYNPEILEDELIYRVAISKFSNRDRALRELNRLRSENPQDQVWLINQ